MNIILASNNENKLREIKEKLKDYSVNVMSQKQAGYDIEVDETGTTLEENAILKAEAIYELSKMPVISDDTGLEIDALNGAPGVYSARFAGENATDHEKRAKVLNLMKDVSEENRTARFKCDICYIDEDGEKHIFEGVAEGRIATQEKGNNGFGYDPIFICEKNKTFAELTGEEKNSISHRGRAVNKFVEYLKNRKG